MSNQTWPRMQLTTQEAAFSSKYEDPRSAKQRVLRRIYTNQLDINASLRADAILFQVSRRCRVFGITAAGDIPNFLVELVDSTGEQYTAGPVHLAALLTGWSPDPLSNGGISWNADGVNGFAIAPVTNGLFVQEPNIVLAPNQALNVNVTPADPGDLVTSFRVEISLHVYEFPGMPGSPL